MNPRNRFELLAVAAAAGPQLNEQELETQRYLADFGAACRAVVDTPIDVRQERVQAVLDLIVKPADAEAVRAAYWTRAPLAARMVAVMAAKLPKERAKDALATFNALERGQMWNAIAQLMADLTMLQKCANGGKMPAAPGVH